MKLTRRVLLTAAFLLLTGLLVIAADKYYDLLFLFYPSFCREILGYLATWAAGFEYVMWQRIALIVLALVIVTLIIGILRRENFFHWLFGWTTIFSVLIFLYMAVWGINQFGPPLAEDMRLDVADEYSADQLQEAAQYYLDYANEYAGQVARDENGLCTLESFSDTAAQVDSGFRNMTRECYAFGGSTEPPKELGLSGLFRKFDVPGLMVCYTGEACVNTKLLPAIVPFEISKQVARRMSIASDEDSSFASILACAASEDPNYQYSGYYMAYIYCYEALNKLDASKAAQITQDLDDGLRADLIANGTLEGTKASFMTISGDEHTSEADHTVADLLVAWYIRQTTPVEEEDDTSSHGAETVPAPDAATQNVDAEAGDAEDAA